MAPFPNLFNPGRIGTVEIPNRIVKSPQTTGFGNADGTVSEQTIRHYRRLAEGGVGLIVIEYTYIDDIASKSIHCQLGISRPDHVAGLGRLVDEVHAAGARIALQIEHCGRQKFLGTPPIKAPSRIPWPLLYDKTGLVPDELTIDEIAAIVEAFGNAAQRAEQAGFDIVEVHGAHGYLITEFLSPHTNQRTDLYGGPFENRTRLLREVLANITTKISPRMPVSIRLSGSDYEPNGTTIDETIEVAKLCEQLGAAAIHVSGGDHHTMHMQVSPALIPLAPHAGAARRIARAVSVPVLVSGSITTPELAEELIASGAGDFISMGRPLLADPHWAAKARSGRADEIRPCIRCNEGCLDRGLFRQRAVGCSVNPVLGHEGNLDATSTNYPRRIAVVGSGPAGLEATRTLADCGHQVTLFGNKQTGGGLRAAAAPDFKTDLARLLHQLRTMITKAGVSVAGRATAEDLLRFDEVVIATGAADAPLDLPAAGNARVVPARDALLEGIDAATVVVVGGGSWGVQTALHLAHGGARVTVVEKSATILAGAAATDLMTYPVALADSGVTVQINTRAIELTNNAVVVDGPQGRREIKADAVVSAVGRTSEPSALAVELTQRGVKVHTIGSAAQLGTLHDALHDAHHIGRRLFSG